jgi:hypothetical protein
VVPITARRLAMLVPVAALAESGLALLAAAPALIAVAVMAPLAELLGLVVAPVLVATALGAVMPLVAVAGTATFMAVDMMMRLLRAMVLVFMLMGISEEEATNSGTIGAQVETGNHYASSHLCLLAKSPLNPASKGLTETHNCSRRPSNKLIKVL